MYKQNIETQEKAQGGCVGPDSTHVKLISSDRKEFVVKREHAMLSGTIRTMLESLALSAENKTNELYFSQIPSSVLKKVCMFFEYKANKTNGSPGFQIEPEMLGDLFTAAFYLDC